MASVTDLIPESMLSIRATLVAKGMTGAAADEAVTLYGQFLDLCASHPQETICPTHAADEAWHAHLDMGAYEADCLRMFGQIAAHDATAFGTLEFRSAWAFTRSAHYERFGVTLENDPDAKGVSAFASASCFRPPLAA